MKIISFIVHALGVCCLFFWVFSKETTGNEMILMAIYAEVLSIWIKTE